MKGIKDKIKNLDIFGYHIGLNFNRNDGYTYKTNIGGISTIFVSVIAFVFTVTCIQKLVQ